LGPGAAVPAQREGSTGFAACMVVHPHSPHIVAAACCSPKVVVCITWARAWYERPSAAVPVYRQRAIAACTIEVILTHSPHVVAAAAYRVELVLACVNVRTCHLRPGIAIPVQGQRPVNITRYVVYPHCPHVIADAAYSRQLVHAKARIGA